MCTLHTKILVLEERNTIVKISSVSNEEMANEMIIELMLLIPILTLALIPIIFYIMCLCQERIKRITNFTVCRPQSILDVGSYHELCC